MIWNLRSLRAPDVFRVMIVRLGLTYVQFVTRFRWKHEISLERKAAILK